jgi:hypothetical protein
MLSRLKYRPYTVLLPVGGPPWPAGRPGSSPCRGPPRNTGPPGTLPPLDPPPRTCIPEYEYVCTLHIGIIDSVAGKSWAVFLAGG